MSDFKKWDVVRANLDPVIGSEQGKNRPVEVISESWLNALLNCINVLPITSRKPGRTVYPNEALLKNGTGGLPNESVVLCHQVRTLDKRRLSTVYGSIDEQTDRDAINDALSFQFGLVGKKT